MFRKQNFVIFLDFGLIFYVRYYIEQNTISKLIIIFIPVPIFESETPKYIAAFNALCSGINMVVSAFILNLVIVVKG